MRRLVQPDRHGLPDVDLAGGRVVFTGGTYMIPCRLRSRLISVQFSGSDLGSFHRIGAIRTASGEMTGTLAAFFLSTP